MADRASKRAGFAALVVLILVLVVGSVGVFWLTGGETGTERRNRHLNERLDALAQCLQVNTAPPALSRCMATNGVYP